MKLTDEIDDIYMRYILLDKDMKQLCLQTKKSRVILNKYITIKEQLDPELYLLLNEKKQLTQEIALFLSKEIINQDIQRMMFPQIKMFPSKKKKEMIKESHMCVICAGETPVQEIFPCCENVMCSKCLYKMIYESFLNICLQKLQCPFCRCELSLDYLRNFLECHFMIKTIKCGTHSIKKYKKKNVFYSLDPWRSNELYKFRTYFSKNCLINLFQNYNYIYKHLSKDTIDCEKYHYGYCHRCIEDHFQNRFTYKNSINRRPERINYTLLGIAEVPKECAREVKEDMFLCEICQSKEEENNVIKSCPHCGIKTIKPTNCNFVRCRCGGKWCYVCNMRLPNTHEGHNVHFWIENGSSPYDNRCRISENYQGESHIMDNCDCSHCQRRNHHPMCIQIDCQKPTKMKFPVLMSDLYCQDCQV